MKRFEVDIVSEGKSNSEYNGEVFSVEDVLRLERDAPFVGALATFEKEAGKPFECIPFQEKEAFLLRRLNELVQIMRVNPVLRQRFDAVGVSAIHRLSDWHRVPITSRADVQDLYTRTKDGLVIPWAHLSGDVGHKLIASGGSSGEPIITLYRTNELRHIGQRAGRFLCRYVTGQDKEKTTFLNLFSNRNGWASNELVQNILEGTGANSLPTGEITLPHAADFFLQQGVTDIVGLPSDFANLVHLLEQGSLATHQYPNVRRALYGGEFMDPSVRDQLRRVFPNLRPVSVYSSTQADFMALQVDERADSLRIADDINFLEIVDDQGNPMPYGQTGRIVVTRLMGNGDQPLRLDIQDKGSISLPDAKDSLHARQLRLYGRVGDHFRVFACDFKASDVLEASHQVLKDMFPREGIKGIKGRQLVVDEEGVHLLIAVDNPAEYPSLDPERQLELMRLALIRSLSVFDDTSTFIPDTPLTIQCDTMDKLERTPTGKIHPFVNKRGDEP